VIDPLVVLAANAKANRAPNIVHDLRNACPQIRAMHIDTNGFVSASDVIANSCRADRIPVCHDTADRHTVADVVVGH
jgi:hypothetical protein